MTPPSTSSHYGSHCVTHCDTQCPDSKQSIPHYQSPRPPTHQECYNEPHQACQLLLAQSSLSNASNVSYHPLPQAAPLAFQTYHSSPQASAAAPYQPPLK